MRHPWRLGATRCGAVRVVCTLFRVGTAGRLAAVTVSIIILIPHTAPLWKVALLRFAEVSWVIVVALSVAYCGAGFAAWWKARSKPFI